MTPFPWRSLDAIRRADIGHLAKLRRATSRVLDVGNAENALREMLAPAELSIQLRRVTSNPPRVEEAAVGVLLTSGERADRRRSFAVVIEQALAATVAARVLRRPSPRVVDVAARASASLAGAMGAILVAVARREALASLRVLTAGPAHTVLGELVAIDAAPLGASFTVLLDHDAYVAHVFAPRSALESLDEPALSSRDLAELGDLPVEVPLVGAFFTMSAAELAALVPGDALVPVDCTRLVLAPPRSDVGFDAQVADDGRLVLREGPHLIEEESVDKEALAQSIGETPIVVRVEVGSAEMSARDWAALGSGDVIALGQRIGEHVVLRVGGVEVARGELVDVEGEIGVRIVSRAGGTVA
jgi:flagellar motor switch/type III secretory pathway protein FliN